MKKMFLICCVIICASRSLRAQVIVDNEFAFGFQNVFNLNIIILNMNVEESLIRMIMFENIETLKKRSVICDVQEYKGRKLNDFVEKDFQIADSLPNPYSGTKTLILVSNDNKSQRAYALIDHFGFALRVMYTDDRELNMEKFITLVRSYTNMKLNY